MNKERLKEISADILFMLVLGLAIYFTIISALRQTQDIIYERFKYRLYIVRGIKGMKTEILTIENLKGFKLIVKGFCKYIIREEEVKKFLKKLK